MTEESDSEHRSEEVSESEAVDLGTMMGADLVDQHRDFLDELDKLQKEALNIFSNQSV